MHTRLFVAHGKANEKALASIHGPTSLDQDLVPKSSSNNTLTPLLITVCLAANLGWDLLKGWATHLHSHCLHSLRVLKAEYEMFVSRTTVCITVSQTWESKQ
jgi:hypothetical protein